MKPFSHKDMLVERRIYNYRLSRARRVVENAFGIMANRFRVFLTTIALAPHKVDELVLAACVLHNYLRDESVRSHWLLTRSRKWCWLHACYTIIYAMKVCDHTGSAQSRETGVGRMRATQLPTR